MAQLAQLLGIPEDQLNQLTVLEAERIALSLNEAVYSAVMANEAARRQVQDTMQPVIRAVRGGRQ